MSSYEIKWDLAKTDGTSRIKKSNDTLSIEILPEIL
jgi:hypothetical protein